jgi:hypothetical protein
VAITVLLLSLYTLVTCAPAGALACFSAALPPCRFYFILVTLPCIHSAALFSFKKLRSGPQDE